MKMTMWSIICALAILSQVRVASVAGSVETDLAASESSISQLCNQPNGDCFDLILQIVTQLLITVQSALQFGPIPGSACLQLLFDSILNLINAVTALVFCILDRLLYQLQSTESQCCTFITELVDLLLQLLVKVLQNLALLVGKILGVLIGGLPVTSVTSLNLTQPIQSFLNSLSNLLTTSTSPCVTQLIQDIGEDIFACLQTFQDSLKNVTAGLNKAVSCATSGPGGLTTIVKQLLSIVANLSVTVGSLLALLDNALNTVLGNVVNPLTGILNGVGRK